MELKQDLLHFLNIFVSFAFSINHFTRDSEISRKSACESLYYFLELWVLVLTMLATLSIFWALLSLFFEYKVYKCIPEPHWWVLGRTKHVYVDIYALNLFIEHSGEHWWEQNIFCLLTTPQVFWALWWHQLFSTR